MKKLLLATILLFGAFAVINAQDNNPIVNRLSQAEIAANKTPSAVAYNFVQAILNKDFAKMTGNMHPEVAIQVIWDIINNGGVDEDGNYDAKAYIESKFSDGKLGILGWLPEISQGSHEMVVAYERNDWFYMPEEEVQFNEIAEDNPDLFYVAQMMKDDPDTDDEDEMIMEIPDEVEEETEISDEAAPVDDMEYIYEDGSMSPVNENSIYMLLDKFRYIDYVPYPRNLFRAFNQVVTDGMIYVPEEDKTYPGVLEKIMYVKCIPSDLVGKIDFQETGQYDDTNVKVILTDCNGKWEVLGFK